MTTVVFRQLKAKKKKKTYLWSQKEPLHSHNQCLAAVENVNFWVCEYTGVLDVPLKPN